MNTTEMMVICREVDRATGKIAVYRIETEVTENLIFKLKLRARLNPELQYFVTTKAHYEGFGNTITAVLKRRTVTPAAIARVGEFGSYEAMFLSLRPSLAFWQMGAAVRKAGRTIRQAARAFGDMFAAMGTALAACFSPALRGYVDDAKEREQKQADFSAAGNVFLPSTHEIIAGAQPEEENTAARWWVKTPNPNYSKPQAEERQG